MIKAFRHTGLVVSDMDRAITFYRNMGFKVLSRELENWDGTDIEVTKLFPCLELVKGDWYPHASFLVDGAMVLKAIREKKTRTHNVYFIKDLDGNVIELVKEKEG